MTERTLEAPARSRSRPGPGDARRPGTRSDPLPAGVKLAHFWSSDLGAALSLPHIRHFAGKGWRIYVICPDGPRLEAVRAAGAVWLPLAMSRRLLDPLGDARAVAQMARYCVSERFDIVHTHNIKPGMLGRLAARAVRAPRIVHTFHGLAFGPETPPAKRAVHAVLEWIAGGAADRLLVQSAADRETLLRGRVVPPEKVIRIGNGIDLTRFDATRPAREVARAALGVDAHDVVFLSAGRTVREKGFVELGEATALARARNPRIRTFVAGPRDAEKADCLTDAEVMRARECGVEFLGDRDDMPALYAASDVVVLPSWREGLPRVLIEGAAMGKALLASDVRGNREVVVVPEGGERAPVRSPAALAEAMLRLAADPARRLACGQFNRALAEREYDIRAVLNRVEGVYRELLRGFP